LDVGAKVVANGTFDELDAGLVGETVAKFGGEAGGETEKRESRSPKEDDGGVTISFAFPLPLTSLLVLGIFFGRSGSSVDSCVSKLSVSAFSALGRGLTSSDEECVLLRILVLRGRWSESSGSSESSESIWTDGVSVW
jgi:hypothetical protein